MKTYEDGFRDALECAALRLERLAEKDLAKKGLHECLETLEALERAADVVRSTRVPRPRVAEKKLDPDRWPITKESPCRWCGKIEHFTRKGIEPEYKKGFSAPKRGTGYYYSAPSHDCPERDRVGKALKATHDKMERAIFGPGKP